MKRWILMIGTRDSGLGTRVKARERGFVGDLPSASADTGRANDAVFCESRATLFQRGFTLLEVLAAIALLAIAFAVGLGALGKSVQNAGRSAALDSAVERAQSLLSGQGLGAPLKDETLSGKFDDGMTWTLKIHALPKPAAAADADTDAALPQQQGVMMAQAATVDLYQLDIAVQYGAGRSLKLSTQRAQAAPERQP